MEKKECTNKNMEVGFSVGSVCGGEMEYICNTGRSIQIADSLSGKITGVKSEELYQCPVCKTIKAL